MLAEAARRAPLSFAGGALAGLIFGPALLIWCAIVNRGSEPYGAGARVRLHARLPILPRYAAVTVGRTVFLRGWRDLALPENARLMRHELTHVRQFELYGWWGMCLRYGALLAACGYAQHPLEQEARAAEQGVHPIGGAAINAVKV